MFKHIVKIGEHYYLRRWTPFGWQYFDHDHYRFTTNGYWWSKEYLHHASRFDSDIELRNILMAPKEKKSKPKFVGWF